MNYGNIKWLDIANGPGIRVSLFVSGCFNNCPGCFNKESQNFNYGTLYDLDTAKLIYEQLNKPFIKGLSILGGDPFCQSKEGIALLCDLVNQTKRLNKTVWLWTGFTWEETIKDSVKFKLLSLCDVVVDNPFIEAKKDLSLKYCGSSNQRVIDVQQTLAQNKIILYKEHT